MSNYDHVQQLRAELSALVDAEERATVAVELGWALARLSEEETALDGHSRDQDHQPPE